MGASAEGAPILFRTCLNTQEILSNSCPAGRAPYAGGGRSRAFLKLRVTLPLVGMRIFVPTNGRPNEMCTANNPR
jgi:hypothetical protein